MKLLGCGRHLTSAWHVILAPIALTFAESVRAKYSKRQFYENFWWQIRICSSVMRRTAVYFCLLLFTFRQIISITIEAFSTRLRLSHAMYAPTRSSVIGWGKSPCVTEEIISFHEIFRWHGMFMQDWSKQPISSGTFHAAEKLKSNLQFQLSVFTIFPR